MTNTSTRKYAKHNLYKATDVMQHSSPTERFQYVIQFKNFYRPTQKIMKVHILAIVLDENITRLHSKTILNELMLE